MVYIEYDEMDERWESYGSGHQLGGIQTLNWQSPAQHSNNQDQAHLLANPTTKIDGVPIRMLHFYLHQ